jgi:hypothetical protein
MISAIMRPPTARRQPGPRSRAISDGLSCKPRWSAGSIGRGPGIKCAADRASCCDLWGANLIPDLRGRGRRRLSPRRRAGAFARAGQSMGDSSGSDGGALPTLGDGRKMRRRDVRPPSDLRNRKSPPRISPRGLQQFRDDGIMPVSCPTCQTFYELNEIGQTRRAHFEDENPPSSKCASTGRSQPGLPPAALYLL